jgi:hypothetical protein
MSLILLTYLVHLSSVVKSRVVGLGKFIDWEKNLSLFMGLKGTKLHGHNKTLTTFEIYK